MSATAQTSAQPEPPYKNRRLAESFGADAERYDRVRPSYPRALADEVLRNLPQRRVVDVGIGTGLSSLPFRDAGAQVVGVDADPRMAALAQARGFEVELGMFEHWDPTGRKFDAVISGQAWHWVDPIAGAARAASVLDPGGRLAVFWNVGDPDPDVAAAFADVYRSIDTGLPTIPWSTSVRDGFRLFDGVTEGIAGVGSFGQPIERRFDWEDTITRDIWLEQVPIARGHDRIAPDRLAQLLDELGKVIDERGGSFTMNYSTVALVAETRRSTE